jgi:hypothetical protein
MGATFGIQIDGLRQFMADARRARSSAGRDISRAIKQAGQPITNRLQGIPARRSGALASGYGVRVRRGTGDIVSKVAYGGGAEFGQRGKWSGFMHYGGPGRFAWKDIEGHQDQIADDIYKGMRDVFEVYGWFR